MYTTTGYLIEDIKKAAEQDDAMFFMKTIAHYISYPLYKENCEVCKTADPIEYKEKFHPSENILTRALYHQTHYHIYLWEGKMCFEGRNIPMKWEIKIPHLVESILSRIEDAAGPYKNIQRQTFAKIWREWLEEYKISIDPDIYRSF